MSSTTPTPSATTVASYLKAQGVNSGAWRDRVYLNDVPQGAKAHLRVPDTVNPDVVLAGCELVVWVDRADDQPWDEVTTTKDRLVAELSARLGPLGLAVEDPAPQEAAPSVDDDSDIPF